MPSRWRRSSATWPELRAEIVLRTVDLAGVDELALEILDPARLRPLVAVTTRSSTAPSLIDAGALAHRIGSVSDVCVLRTGDVTWRLTELLPPKLDVYGGAVRVWWPGVSPDSDPYDHPLLFVWDEQEARRVADRVVAALGVQPRNGADEKLAPGTVVEVEVAEIVAYGAFVRLDSGRRGLVHVSELVVQHPAQVVETGDRYRAAVLWDDDRGLAVSFVRRPEASGVDQEENVSALRSEVRALAEDRRAALEELRKTKERVRDLERRLREARGPNQPREEARLDESRFLALVRASYDERYTNDDARHYPLRKVTVGCEFLERVSRLDGVGVDKIAEVSADVAARRAHEFAGREVHALRSGEGGAPQRVRNADGATAWRCALQVGTPSARRLHWWELPDGGVELASVGPHDDFSIPE